MQSYLIAEYETVSPVEEVVITRQSRRLEGMFRVRGHSGGQHGAADRGDTKVTGHMVPFWCGAVSG